MRKRRATLLMLFGLLLLPSFILGSGGDWQYFNSFNLVSPKTGDPYYGATQIPSHYNSTFSAVSSFTRVRNHTNPLSGAVVPDWNWATYERGNISEPGVDGNTLRDIVGVYGLDGVDNVYRSNEILVQPREDRAVMRFDLLAATQMIYIAAIRITIWGNCDFDPRHDLAPLFPDSAVYAFQNSYSASDTTRDYYTGVQFYVENDEGYEDVAYQQDNFDSMDVDAHVEPLMLTTDVHHYDLNMSSAYVPATAGRVWDFNPLGVSNMDDVMHWVNRGSENVVVAGVTRAYTKWTATMVFHTAVSIPPQESWSGLGRNLPFKRMWVVLRSNKAHYSEMRPIAGDPTLLQGSIEGISSQDTFFVGIQDDIHTYPPATSYLDTSFYCYLNDAYQHITTPPDGNFEVTPTSVPPASIAASMRQRWNRAEWIAGMDSIPPIIYDMYPNNTVGSNGSHSDAQNVDGVDAIWGNILTLPEHEWNSFPSYPSHTSGVSTTEQYVYTADSVQLISFVVQDKQTSIDSVIVEIRYLNGGTYPCRIDTVFFRNTIDGRYDPIANGHCNDGDINGGWGDGWEWRFRYDGNDADCLNNMNAFARTWTEAGVITNSRLVDGAGDYITAGDTCGVDSFWVAVGDDRNGDFLDQFLDGALVKVTVKAFNRNDHWEDDYNPADPHVWENPGTDFEGRNVAVQVWAETSWCFVVDLSGPNAWLVCPFPEGHDDETKEFHDYTPIDIDYNRSDNIANYILPFAWQADSLPLFHIHVSDLYSSVHDVANHGVILNGAYGGSGFNQRDFEITFYVHREGVGTETYLSGPCMDNSLDILTVTEQDMIPFLYCSDWVQGVYYDESDNGIEGELYVNFEYLKRSPRADRDLFRLKSGDKVYIVFTRFMDDPDFGQTPPAPPAGSVPPPAVAGIPYPYTTIDLDVSSDNTWCTPGGDDPNYGVNDAYQGDAAYVWHDNHKPVMQNPSLMGCPGYTTYYTDTLGILRVDLKGPLAPDTLYYPPNGWITSDSFQVITCDIFDRIGDNDDPVGCVDNRLNYDDPIGAANYGPLYTGVSGVASDSITMNIKVRGCDGSWHSEYGGVEGRDWKIAIGGSAHPNSYPNLVIEKIRMHNANREWWGTRVVYDPYRELVAGGRRELAFRPGDEVCVTVYASDNAYLDCSDGRTGYGPCPHSEGGFDVDANYFDGTEKFSFMDYVPGVNWSEDGYSPDGLLLAPRQIARWTFYVDTDAPIWVNTDFEQCPFGWDFTIRDISDHVGPIWCDEHVADVAAVDMRLITIDDMTCPTGSVLKNDTIFVNDLYVGAPVEVIYHNNENVAPATWIGLGDPFDNIEYGFTRYYGTGMDSCSCAPCCTIETRHPRYLHVRFDDDLDPEETERQAILRLYWGDSQWENCHFFEPNDSIKIELYASDAVNVPWFPATERPMNWRGIHFRGTAPWDYFCWHHEDDCYTSQAYLDPDDLGGTDPFRYATYTAWRDGVHNYTTAGTILNYREDGRTAFSHQYRDWENPNWKPIRTELRIYQSDLSVPEVHWFNDSAYRHMSYGLPFSFFPDLHGLYTDMSEVKSYDNVRNLSALASARVVDTTVADSIMVSSLRSSVTKDFYLNDWTKELNFITFEIQSCTDSLVYECHTYRDTLKNITPYARVMLFDSLGMRQWKYDDWFDCDCIHCWLHYTPLRDGVPYGTSGCIDGGLLTLGPLDQLGISESLTTDSTVFYNATTHTTTLARRVRVLSWGWPKIRGVRIADVDTYFVSEVGDSIRYTKEAIYGMLNRDSLVIVTRFATRNANQFTIDTIADYHYYAWAYRVDMAPPTAHFTSLLATTGYEEVNCVERHDSNNDIRVRLEAIFDSGVGCSAGGTDAAWATTWPLPAVVPTTDIIEYFFAPGRTVDTLFPNEPIGLVYNPGTTWLYSNERMDIHNCTDENKITRIMGLASPITLYHGVDPLVPTVFQTTINNDTLLIADSLLARVTIQDRLGNRRMVESYPMGLDNGLPKVKGFSFCTAIKDPISGEITSFNCWDRELFRLPWEVPAQDSLVGVFNFSGVCTVYVRLWFDDHMDMRDIDPMFGHVVRFQPEGWTHWFPIIPVNAHAGFYPLVQTYADYLQVGHGPVYRTASDDGSVFDVETPRLSDIEPGWNSDREWIGFMVIAGEGMMDGVATLRVQGFDDNGGNVMLDHEYPFRIETRYHAPQLGWPTPDASDITEYHSWEMPYQGGRSTISGYSDAGVGTCDTSVAVTYCNALTGFDFDRSITDSVVFLVWSHDLEWTAADIPAAGGTILDRRIDNMSSPFIWDDPITGFSFARWPCDSFDLAKAIGARNAKFVTVEFRAYSRFYPTEYVSDTLLNTWVDNKDLNCGDIALTNEMGGEVPAGTDTLIFQPTTTSIRFVFTGIDADIVDSIYIELVDAYTLATTPVTIGRMPIDLSTSDGLWFDPASGTITYIWNCAGTLFPGFYYVRYVVTDVIQTAQGVTAPTGYDVAYHNTCCTRTNVLVPREAFLARGNGVPDAMMRTSCNFADPLADDIYPWPNEDRYPDWPAWTSFRDTVVETHPWLSRFQVTTYTHPDLTSGDGNPLMPTFVEQGGEPGESVYVMFEVFPEDEGLLDSARMVIMDQDSLDATRNISGSNFRIEKTFGVGVGMPVALADDRVTLTDCLGNTHTYFIYNWVIDDQANRYDGPVEIRFTTFKHPVGLFTPVWTTHQTFVYLDTYDPEYRVAMTRVGGSAMRTCLNDSLPREVIWVTNADTVDIWVDWFQTLFDQSTTGEDYISYDDNASTRTWDYLRMTIDGQPNEGFYHMDDPNDLAEASLWHNVNEPMDYLEPFWHTPDPTGYTGYPTAETYFNDARYRYRWTVAQDTMGNGLAVIMVKGRDCAGNILDYEEAKYSRSYGKYVLIDTRAPIVDGSLCTITPSSFVAANSAIWDNLLGGGFYDPITHTYVEVTIYDLTTTMSRIDSGTATIYGGPYPVMSDAANFGSVAEDIASIPETAGDYVLVCARDLAGNMDCDTVVVGIERECCEWNLCAGWNLVALSVVPDDLSKTAVFGSIADVYTYIGSTFAPAPEILDVNYGYHVLVTAPTTIEVCGAPLASVTLGALPTQWTSLGSPWGGAPTTAINVIPAGAVDLANTYTYNCSARSYTAVTNFVQCSGLMVWITTDVTSLSIEPTKIVGSVKKRTSSPLWSAKLGIDATDFNRTLEVGVVVNGTNGYDEGADVPALPVFPGEKEAYVGSRLSSDFRGEGIVIDWKATSIADFTLTSDLTNVPEEYNLFLVNGMVKINLREIDRLALKAGEYTFVAERKALPTTFALGQNMPNPFNATTAINYQLPQKAKVTISVIDMQGHKVRTLVSEEQSAGYRSIVWDGTDDNGTTVTSGVYFYQINAGSFSETKRMILSK